MPDTIDERVLFLGLRGKGPVEEMITGRGSTLDPDADRDIAVTVRVSAEHLSDALEAGLARANLKVFTITDFAPETACVIGFENDRPSLCLLATREFVEGSDLRIYYARLLEGLESGRYETVADLRWLFFEHVGWDFVDPFFDEEATTRSIHCAGGRTIDEFISLCSDLVSAVGVPLTEHARLLVSAKSDTKPARRAGGQVLLEPWVEDLIDAIIDVYEPSGLRYLYDDGDPERVSGYRVVAHTFEVPWRALSAIEKAGCMDRLRLWCSRELPSDHALFARRDCPFRS